MQDRVTRFDLGAVAFLSVASGLVYFAAGVRFDTSPFPGYIQFIDAPLLRERLLESVWYSHAHPPGLNLLVGVGYRVFGEHAPVFFSLLFHGLGFALGLAVFALVLRLTQARLAAYLCTALLVMSPGFVLYENWLMYTFLEAVLLTVSAVALYKTLDRASTIWAFALFTVLAVLVLTRGFFHLGWLVLIVAYVAWVVPHRSRVLLAAAGPLLVATLWYAKNYFYYGAFAASTMFGLGLSNIGTLTLPRETLSELVDLGVVSPLALVSRYENTPVLFSATSGPPTGIPVLDRPQKAAGGYNYNYRPLVELNEQYARDSLAVIRLYPANYAIGVVIANRLFFSPSSMNEYFSPENRAAAIPFEQFYNPVVYGVSTAPRYAVQPHFGFDRPPSLEVNTSVRLIGLWLLALVFGWLRLRPGLLGREGVDRTACVTVGYLLFALVYVHALGTLVELGENTRYRFVVEPLFAVLIATLATDGVRRFARWVRRVR